MEKEIFYDFFKEFLEDAPNLFIIISKFENGTYAMFVCQEDDGKCKCGGHIGLYNSENTSENQINLQFFIQLLDWLQKCEFKIVFDLEWWSNL